MFVAQLFVVIFIIALLFAISRMRKQAQRRDATLQTLQDDLAALCNGAVGIGDHLCHVEQRVRKLSERQDQVDLHDPDFHSFDHAIRLVQNGASVEEVMANCGLARSEAELVVTLHRTGKIAQR
jgi:DNA-binding transcriptional regulator of glucitol operon